MRFYHFNLSVVFLMVLAGCASKSDLDYLRSDMDELKSRIFKTEKDLGSLKSETKEGVEKNLKVIQGDMDTVRKGEADLQATLEGMKVDMQVLAGKLDDTSLLAKKPADELALQKEDANRRFAALEERLDKVEKALDEQKKTGDAKAENPDDLYQKGLAAFKGGDVVQAREMLARFVERYPSHSMVSNARYWLGETYYSEKKYDQAILEFQEVIKNFPGKEKVPAAMLKQGMAFKELGDVKSCRYLYKKVIEDFPMSDEAKIAREKLKTLK